MAKKTQKSDKKEKSEAKSESKKESEIVQNNGVFGGFFEFLRKYSVIGLAIGIVIGDSSKSLVNSIVSGIITPFLGLFLPNKDSLQNMKVILRNQTFEIGVVIQSALSFIIILFLIYFVIKILLKKEEWIEEKK